MSRERNDANSPQRMTAKQINMRKAQRRRKRKLKQLRFFLVLFMLACVVTLSLTVFFKIDKIRVTGISRYSSEAIIEKSELVTGKNLFLYNTSGAGKKVTENFVYIQSAKVKKYLPGTLEIVVTEAKEVCTIEGNDGYYVISDEGKVLEKTEMIRTDLYNVKGIDMTPYKIGSIIEGNSAESVKTLNEVTNAADAVGLKNITLIDLSDIYNIEITYQDRVVIKCGTQVEIEYKLKYAKKILEENLSEIERGTLNVSTVHTTENAVFSPYHEEMLPSSSEETSSETTSEE